MKRAAATAVVALLLAGCSAGMDSATDEAARTGSQTQSGAGESAPDAADTDDLSGDGLAGDGLGAALAEEERQVITEGSVTVTVEDPRVAAQSAALLVERVGGRVQERQEQAATDRRDASASLVVRVPSTEVSQVVDQLDRLGDVESVELLSTDVTMQSRDLDARVRALQLSVERLEDLLSRAQSTSDLVSAEQTLTQRQAELESLQSQRTRLADQVEMSTLQVSFWTEDAVPAPTPSGFSGGLSTGWDSLVTFLGTLMLVVGVLLPWVLLAGLVLLLVLGLRRWLVGRVAPAAVPPAPPEPAGVGGTADASNRPTD